MLDKVLISMVIHGISTIEVECIPQNTLTKVQE